MSSGLGAAFSALILGCALALGWQGFGPAVLSGGLAAALLGLVLLTVTGGGRIALKRFGARDLSESEKTLIGATLGLGLLSQGIFLLGAAGWLKAWAISALMGLFWVIGFTEMRDVLRSLTANSNLLRDRPLAAGGVLAALALLLWMCFIPPHQYDALVYHLPLAAAYVRAGRIYPVEHLLYTHFPQNAEMLYTLALLLGSDLLAQMFTWLGTFLSVWWVFEMGKREVPAAAVLLACLLIVTHTSVMLLTSTTYVECLVMLWVTASVLSFLRWRERSLLEDYTRGWLALSGLFAGLGVGTKYYAGITPAILSAYLAYRWGASRFGRGEERLRSGDRARDVLVFCAAAALAGSPWLVKNAFVVGNPVFPFLFRWLPPRGVEWGDSAARYFEVFVEYNSHPGHPLLELIRFPLRAAAASTLFGGGADVLGDLGWGLLFASLPAAIWAARKNRYLRWVLAYCAAHWAIWYHTGVVLRFLVVLVPLASLPAAHGLFKTWEAASGAGRAALGAGVAGLLLVNFGLFLFVHDGFESLSVLTGSSSRQQYLARRLDYYPCARFARDGVPPEEKILVVGEQRGYYVSQPQVTTTTLAPNGFVRLANASSGPEDLAQRLKSEGGFRYLLVVPRESKRLGEGYGVFHFTESGSANWSALEDGFVTKVFDAPGRCALYRIN